ncbi:MAG: hypothetical protein OEW60_02705 [Thiovulaceae bacterium]|nr:hypothetical protein [Sulfurimonadaceae bacterium]
MKISSATTPLALPLEKLIQAKTLSTLLQLSKPLNNNQAIVRLLTSNQEVTLQLKTPLEKEALYHAVLQKKDESYTLKELFKLPLPLKQLLKAPALLTLENLIQRLAKADDPQKIAIETLAAKILTLSDKEQATVLLDQLSQQLLSDSTSLIYEHHGLKGYVKFKKNKRGFSQEMLRFEAYFPLLGALKGAVSLVSGRKRAKIIVISQRSKEILEAAKENLPMLLTVLVEEDLGIVVPTQKLLDLKG